MQESVEEIKKRKNLNQILLSVDSENVNQDDGANDQEEHSDGRHLQVYRYLRAWFYRISFEPVERGPCPQKVCHHSNYSTFPVCHFTAQLQHRTVSRHWWR